MQEAGTTGGTALHAPSLLKVQQPWVVCAKFGLCKSFNNQEEGNVPPFARVETCSSSWPGPVLPFPLLPSQAQSLSCFHNSRVGTLASFCSFVSQSAFFDQGRPVQSRKAAIKLQLKCVRLKPLNYRSRAVNVTSQTTRRSSKLATSRVNSWLTQVPHQAF